MRPVRRVAPLALAGALALSAAACTCPDPITLDQVFLLDATSGDAGDGRADGGSSQPGLLDCSAMAAACVPGGPCRPACDCVLARDRVSPVAAVQSCTLLVGSGPPAVEIRYQRTVFCGGD